MGPYFLAAFIHKNLQVSSSLWSCYNKSKLFFDKKRENNLYMTEVQDTENAFTGMV